MYRKKIPFSSKDSIAGSVRGMKGCRKGAGRAITFILAGILAAAPVMNALAVEESDENRKMAEESGTGRGTTGNVSDRNSGGDDETAGGKTGIQTAKGTSEEDTKQSEDGTAEDKDIISVEEANATMAAYDGEDAEWEEVYIGSVEDMKRFARDCWLDTWSVNKKVYLVKDLDLSGSDFVPVPTFGGYFDGQGHTVSGLQVRDDISYTGLFCYTQVSAVIVDLKVQGSVCPSGKSMVVGGVVGDNSGIIMNCSFEGNVEGGDYVGGITGFNEQSGILIDCTGRGKVTGTHYTGGIAGENTGNITGCVNEAEVNTSNEDKAQSLEDINLEQYAAGLFDTESGDGKSRKASTINNTIDSGGIAGLSTGIIQYCSNSGVIGYGHVGYNTGGIVGRQSGYVYSCENTGTVYGRKDVGGIAGQTEPYIAVDLSEDIAYQLSENIDTLHDLTGRMLDDAGAESDTVSARLTMIQEFVDKALDDTNFLADRTIEWTDGMIGSANDVMGRLDYVMDESGKSGGLLDWASDAAGNARDAARELGNTVEALDIYQYMTQEEREQYDAARVFLESAPEQYGKDRAKVVKAYQNYYIDKIRSENEAYTRALSGSGTDAEATSGSDSTGAADNVGSDTDPAPGTEEEGRPEENTDTNTDSDTDTGSDLQDVSDESSDTDLEQEKTVGSGQTSKVADQAGMDAGMFLTSSVLGERSSADHDPDNRFHLYVAVGTDSGMDSGDAVQTSLTESYASSTSEVNENNLRPKINGEVEGSWVWNSANTYGQYFNVEGWVHYDPASGVLAEFPQSEGEWAELDRKLLNDVAEQMELHALEIERNASAYADEQYRNAHPGTAGYEQDLKDNLTTMADIAVKASERMSKEARSSLQSAVNYARDASGNLEAAGSEAKHIFQTVNGMPDILLPQLGSDYRSRAGSLNSNLKGLSENMGRLNDEMSSTNDVMLDDLSKINDQFSKIMRLYTDAIDGVLDMDYTTVYEDNSQEDAMTSTDATIADCANRGVVQGDLNVSGIAGTMAIEYDFDLEGDVTGIENARLNSTFLAKCVLRQNINEGNITAQKSYVGGITGLQEMGTILRCENYGRVGSTAGNYVGGIAGKSLSYITNGYAKCTVSGEEYVAGIAGAGSSMENCCAMVRVQDAAAFCGAIAGETDSSGTVFGNCFVSDELAGIDRISYSGKAEPVSYEELLDTEGLPNRFRMMAVTFYADEEEVKRVECPYGGNVLQDIYPDIPAKDGFYADWDIREIRNIMYDEDVTAEYVRYLTTLASGQTRGNGQSVLLADGMFKQEETLKVTGGSIDGSSDPGVSLKGITESWQITVPEDGNERHQLRYQAPQGQTEGVRIYLKEGGEWRQADTELMGIYHLLTIDGTEAEIAVCVQERNIADYLVYIVPVAAVVTIPVIIFGKKKRKIKRVDQAE